MALPGLGLAGPATTFDTPEEEQQQETRIIELAPGSEWRFETAFTSPPSNIDVRPLHEGGYTEENAPSLAEIFGSELAPGASYAFAGTKAAIFSHDGCRLELSGARPEADYVAEESQTTLYANIHFALENVRAAVAADRSRLPPAAAADAPGGPRVLVLGPDDSGKTSLVKTLAAYAVRAGRAPCVVNLDPREGMLALPGCVSAAVFGPGSMMDVDDSVGSNGWGSSPVQGSSAAPLKLPVVYHYGAERPEEMPEVFKPVVSRLALAVSSRFEEDGPVKEAGILVDMAGSVCSGKAGMDIIEHVISELSITVVLVLGSERVASDIQKRHSAPQGANAPESVAVLKLPKSGGATDRDTTYMTALRTEQVKQYFFGTRRQPLSPHTQMLDLSLLRVLRVPEPEDAELAGAFLPGDAEGGKALGGDDGHRGAALYAQTGLTLAAAGALLVIKHAAPTDPHETIRDAPVLGYLYVADVDMEKRRVRLLSPVGGRLPERAIVWGRWPEGMGDLMG